MGDEQGAMSPRIRVAVSCALAAFVAWPRTTFAQAGFAELGNSSRNPARGPGYRNLDLDLLKRTPVGGGRTAVELRIEAFNVTNRRRSACPPACSAPRASDRSRAPRDPRGAQLGVKYIF
jgi:hypothetical protein